MRLDAHQHFWRYDKAQHVWMTDAMAALRRDYLPEDLAPLLQQTRLEGTIAVQARQMVEETEWRLALAERHTFIRGVVGWVDLRSPDVGAQIERLGANPRLVGVRHVVHDEPDDDFMLRPEFRRGIAPLGPAGLTYDPARLFFQFYGDLMFKLSKPLDVVDLTQSNKFTQLIRQEGVVLYEQS